MPETTTRHIEDTIFDANLPCNPIPVTSRLLELIKEHDTNDPKELVDDLRIRKALWLLNHMFQRSAKIEGNLHGEFQKLKKLDKPNVVEMGFDEWWEKFRPLQNGISDREEFQHCLFETYGRDLDFIQNSAKKDRRWTLVETDGNMYILEGYHQVNRQGYFVTRKPFEPGIEYQIIVE